MMKEQRISQIVSPRRMAESKRNIYIQRKKEMKIVIVGDGAIGKTCLIWVYKKRTFPSEYIPTVVENYHCSVDFGGCEVNLEIFDTAGQEDYDMLRTLSYPGTEVFLVCFAVDDSKSLHNVRKKWVPEILENCPDAKMILVGTKGDLRDKQQKRKSNEEQLQQQNENLGLPQQQQQQQPPPQKSSFISKKKAEKVSNELNFLGYYETSAMLNRGISQVFLRCVECTLNAPKASQKGGGGKDGKDGGKCIIL